jgi:hypothetical protein
MVSNAVLTKSSKQLARSMKKRLRKSVQFEQGTEPTTVREFWDSFLAEYEESKKEDDKGGKDKFMDKFIAKQLNQKRQHFETLLGVPPSDSSEARPKEPENADSSKKKPVKSLTRVTRMKWNSVILSSKEALVLATLSGFSETDVPTNSLTLSRGVVNLNQV